MARELSACPGIESGTIPMPRLPGNDNRLFHQRSPGSVLSYPNQGVDHLRGRGRLRKMHRTMTLIVAGCEITYSAPEPRVS